MPFIVTTHVSACSPRAPHALRSDQLSHDVCLDEDCDVDDDSPFKKIVLKVLAKKTKMRRPVEIFWNTIRINMLETETKKSDSGLISCEVTKPTPKEIIKRLALRDWKLKTIP